MDQWKPTPTWRFKLRKPNALSYGFSFKRLGGRVLIFLAGAHIFVVSGIARPQAPRAPLGDLFLAFIEAIPLIAIGIFLLRRHAKERQSRLDRVATEILSSDGNQKGGYFLYLRPFGSTQRFCISPAYGNPASMRHFETGGSDDIETLLRQALSATGSLVALGKPGEHIGAGRAQSTDATWQDDVKKLAASARLIFLLPSHKPGTLWEISHLKTHDLLKHTILIMPPAVHPSYRTTDPDTARDWSLTQYACKPMGIKLPDFRATGALFRLTEEPDCPEIRELPDPEPSRWAYRIQELASVQVKT
jgi:hypothetical protein